MQEMKIHVSTETILKTLGILVAVYVVYVVSNILLLVFLSLILSALIDPFATWFEKKKIPRGLAVLLIYTILFGVIGLSIAVLAPVLASDVPQLVDNIGKFWQSVMAQESVQEFLAGLQNIQGALGNAPVVDTTAPAISGPSVEPTISGIYSTVSGVFGGLFSLVIVLVMTMYMVVQDDPLRKILVSVVPDDRVPYWSDIIKRMRDKLGLWMRGQLILSAIIGTLVFVGLTILGVKYAAVLAILAAILEFVPYIGPILAAIPALLFAFSGGGVVKLIAVAVMYVIIQQLENHLLVPKIMQRAVGLNPIVSIVAILIGARLAGVIGALLAIPVATALSVFLKDVFTKKAHN